MNDPKPLASLSPTLLARKGAARPAMRPQVATLTSNGAPSHHGHDDLGWNDMGHDHHNGHFDAAQGYSPAQIQVPSPNGLHAPLIRHEPVAMPQAPVPQAEVVAINDAPLPQQAPVPPVVHQQAEVAARVGAHMHREAVPSPVRRSALDEGRRAAFTLRLDAERHLKLRLACTIAGRSAQLLVTDALDRLIAELPDVDTLAAQVRKAR